MNRSAIEWTDAVWNPVRGCSIVSAGCTNCYAMRQAHRFSGKGGPYEGLTKMTRGGPVWTGKIRLVYESLDAPFRWQKPRRVFVNSMSDLFHEDVPDEFIREVFERMALAPEHTFQVLTKRPERMRALRQDYAVVPNVWLGVSVEDQRSAEERIPILLQTPAALHWVSAEPLLEAVNLYPWWFHSDPWWILEDGVDPGLDWVVVGGESGPKARPFDVEWARAIVDRCRAMKTACFVKQLGSRARMEIEPGKRIPLSFKARKGGDPAEWPADLRVREWPA